MSVCPHCRSDNDPANEQCQKCSRPLDPAARAASRSNTLFGVAAPPLAPGPAPDTIPGGPARSDQHAQKRADTIPGGPGPSEASESPARAGGSTFSGVGPATGSKEKTLLGVAPGPPGDPQAAPGPVVTLAGGVNRTLSGVTSDAALDQTIMGSFAPVPASARGATSPGVGSSGKAKTLPGPGDAPFAAVPAARAPLGMTHGPWLAGAGAAPDEAEANPAEAKPAAPLADARAPDVLGADSPHADAPAVNPAAGVANAAALPSFGRTHLGVATPGIAPIRMSTASTPAAAPVPAPAPAPQYTAPLEPRSAGTLATKLKVPRSALVLIATGALLLGAAGVVAVMWRGQPPLSALVSITDAGKERIDIVCEQCPDGTSIGLGNSRAEVQQRKAYLDAPAPLRVGDNPLVLEVSYPEGRQTNVELNLPVEYRVRTDSAGFDAPLPYVSVIAEALPGSRVVVAGKELVLDPGGRAEHQIELGARISGAAGEVVPLTESIPYAITSPAGHDYTGELKLNVGITPLDVESPGAETITSDPDFVLAGRTAKGARVVVAGASLEVDASGRFSQSMSIDAPGESSVTVRAVYDNLAPRLLTFQIRRVEDLADEERRLRADALDLASAIRDPEANRGRLVFVRGRVQDARIVGERTILIVEPSKGCAERACLARLVSGGRHELKPGARVEAFGRFGGELEALGKGRSVAEVVVSLLDVK
jgi:hypothetical protein